MKKVAMLSYNTILPHRGNGWVTGNRNLYLIQDDNGKSWFEQRRELNEAERRNSKDAIGTVKNVVRHHWDQLSNMLNEFDQVIIYVGANGSEVAIECAAQSELPPEKAVFVMCNCNRMEKRVLMEKNGFGTSIVKTCECGGHRSMAKIAERFLETGHVIT